MKDMEVRQVEKIKEKEVEKSGLKTEANKC